MIKPMATSQISGATMRRCPWTIWPLAAAMLLAGGCDRFPDDPEHSLDNIRSRGVVRIGTQPVLPPEAEELVRRIERATGARAQLREGALEPMLSELEKGKIDLVIAPFRKDTPWAAMTALSPPLRAERSGKAGTEWRAAMRSGENRWILLVETEARKAAGARIAS